MVNHAPWRGNYTICDNSRIGKNSMLNIWAVFHPPRSLRPTMYWVLTPALLKQNFDWPSKVCGESVQLRMIFKPLSLCRKADLWTHGGSIVQNLFKWELMHIVRQWYDRKTISETKSFVASLGMCTLKAANIEAKQQRDCKSQCWLTFHQPRAPRLPATRVCRRTSFLQLVSHRVAKWNPGFISGIWMCQIMLNYKRSWGVMLNGELKVMPQIYLKTSYNINMVFG